MGTLVRVRALRLVSRFPVRIFRHDAQATVVAVHLDTRAVPLLATVLLLDTVLLRTSYSGTKEVLTVVFQATAEAIYVAYRDVLLVQRVLSAIQDSLVGVLYVLSRSAYVTIAGIPLNATSPKVPARSLPFLCSPPLFRDASVLCLPLPVRRDVATVEVVRILDASSPSDVLTFEVVTDDVVPSFVTALQVFPATLTADVPTWIVRARELTKANASDTAVLVPILRRDKGVIVAVMTAFESEWLKAAVPCGVARA